MSTQCDSCQRKIVNEDDPRQKSRCKTCGLLALPRKQKRSSAAHRVRNLRTRYGMTPDQFYFLLDSQDNCCAICETELNPGTSYRGRHKKPMIDHCHATGNIRGILCNGCNLIIGHASDDIPRLEKAIVYLRERGMSDIEAKN